MKISYRTHPALEMLSGDLTKIWIDQKDSFEYFQFEDFFKQKLDNLIRGLDKKNIIKPSLPFLEAAWESCKQRSFEQETEFSECLNNESGAILYRDRVTFFHLKTTPKKNIAIQYATFDNNKNMLVDFCLETCEETSKISAWKTKTLDKTGGVLDSPMGYLLWVKTMIVCVCLFKKYAKVEIKHVEPGERIKDISCKYVNDTKLGITYMDSKWFTTLVKSDAFKVRGHFRLQPKKVNGEWTKEIIWINDFEKSGYTRKAGIIAQ